MNESRVSLSLFSFLIVLTSAFIIAFRIKKGAIIGSVPGLHIMFFFFFGVGPLFYTNSILPFERIDQETIIAKSNVVVPYLFLGYLTMVLLDIRKLRMPSINYFEQVKAINLNSFNLQFLTISLVGVALSSSALGSSGVGTFIPIVGNFLFPITILIIIKYKKTDLLSTYIVLFLLGTVGLITIFSAWRSQLFMFLGSVLIGINFRKRINPFLLLICTALIIYFLLPFQELKKKQAEDYDFNVNSVFQQSLELNWSERVEVISAFFGQRINYSREIGYIQNAVDENRIQYRFGETYKEVLYQLIPRWLWKDKPIYNLIAGYEISRASGLVGKDDQGTSWAVTCFAEFIYNFPYIYLPLFMLILYLIFSRLDDLPQRLDFPPPVAAMTKLSLFFLSLKLVSVLFSSTYFLWTILILIFYKKAVSSVNESTDLRRA